MSPLVPETRVSNRRRKHKNSKNGCPNCKKRRVKCSEHLPQCHNCIKHKVKCGYLDYTPQQLQEHRDAKAAQAEEDERNGSSNNLASLASSLNDVKEGSNSRNSSKSPVEMGLDHVDGSIANHESFIDHYSMGPGGAADIEHEIMEFNFNDNRRSTLALEISERDNLYLDNNVGPDSKATVIESPLNSTFVGKRDKKVLQNYDNVSSDPNNIIMYPVYSFGKEHSHLVGSIHAASASLASFSHMGTTESYDSLASSNNAALIGIPNTGEYSQFHSASSVGHNNSIVLVDGVAHYDQIYFQKAGEGLPNCVRALARFDRLKIQKINYRTQFEDAIAKAIPRFANGTIRLREIRGLYKMWLHFFYFYAQKYSQVLFLCLINFLTNYLISNFFESPRTMKLSVNEKRQLKNQLVVISIKHYGITIKGLRDMLRLNSSPEVCSLVLYILLLMSIYDPEATPNSILCFRDGLFLVLLYYELKPTTTVPALIPAHLQLMKNISRLVYMPSYNPGVLSEFLEVLNNFGPYLSSDNKFAVDKHKSLCSYVQDAINVYIPRVNLTLDDPEAQHDVLFEMLHRWVRIFSSRLINYSGRFNSVDSVLCLFFEALRKILFAICPQVRFFLLKDFDQALFMDIYDSHIPKAILENTSHAPAVRNIAVYLCRVSTFFTLRMLILYYQITHNKELVAMFPIKDLKKWHHAISSVKNVREAFLEKSGFKEEYITKLGSTTLQKCHFPHSFDDEIEIKPNTIPNYNTFQINGLLADDYDPNIDLGRSP